MRPKKARWVRCDARERLFHPIDRPMGKMQTVVVTLDEIEAMRLAHLDELEQVQVSKQMKIHRSTVSRILASAHKKLARALVHCMAIKVEKGCCQFVNSKC